MENNEIEVMIISYQKDKHGRSLNIGDTVLYEKPWSYGYESSKIIGYAGYDKVIVKGNFIDGSRIVNVRECSRKYYS